MLRYPLKKNGAITEEREMPIASDDHITNKSYNDSKGRFYFNKNLMLRNTENKNGMIEEP